MNIFNVHNIKAEKHNAILQYHQFKVITKLFRLLELFSALVLISWIINRLPFLLKISTDYFRQLLSVLVSPLFIFLVGNVIVLTLVLKSGQLTGNFNVQDVSVTDLYEEIVNNATEIVPVPDPDPVSGPPVREPEEIVYQDKRIISEVNANTNCKPVTDYDENETKVSVTDLDLKVYERSQSENLMKRERDVEVDEVCGKLKRSETEIGRRKGGAPVGEKSGNDVVEELSNEEFNRRIEGFIARQVRFHQEEKLSVVVPHSVM